MQGMTNEAVAATWCASLESGDFGALADLSAPDMRVWHSHDNVWLTRAESEARMAASGGLSAAPSFIGARYMVTETGFVLQASMAMPGVGSIHIVQVNTVKDGRIAACEEYVAPEMSLGG